MESTSEFEAGFAANIPNFATIEEIITAEEAAEAHALEREIEAAFQRAEDQAARWMDRI